MRGPVVLAAVLVQFRVAGLAEAPRTAALPPSRAKDEAAISGLVYARMYRDYCSRPADRPNVVFIRNSANPAGVVPAVLAAVRKHVPVPVKHARDMDEGGGGTHVDRQIGKRGVVFEIREIAWSGARRAAVLIWYGRSDGYGAMKTYQVDRDRGRWVVAAERTADPPDQCLVRGRVGLHTYEIVIAKRPFRPQQHALRRLHDDGEYTVDGSRYPPGSTGAVPFVELCRFDVRVDGVRWPVPRRLWRDCYEVHLGTTGKFSASWRKPPRPPRSEEEAWLPEYSTHGVLAWLSSDGRRLHVLMSGSDGGGAFATVWHFRSDGHATRDVYGP